MTELLIENPSLEKASEVTPEMLATASVTETAEDIFRKYVGTDGQLSSSEGREVKYTEKIKDDGSHVRVLETRGGKSISTTLTAMSQAETPGLVAYVKDTHYVGGGQTEYSWDNQDKTLEGTSSYEGRSREVGITPEGIKSFGEDLEKSFLPEQTVESTKARKRGRGFLGVFRLKR